MRKRASRNRIKLKAGKVSDEEEDCALPALEIKSEPIVRAVAVSNKFTWAPGNYVVVRWIVASKEWALWRGEGGREVTSHHRNGE